MRTYVPTYICIYIYVYLWLCACQKATGNSWTRCQEHVQSLLLCVRRSQSNHRCRHSQSSVDGFLYRSKGSLIIGGSFCGRLASLGLGLTAQSKLEFADRIPHLQGMCEPCTSRTQIEASSKIKGWKAACASSHCDGLCTPPDERNTLGCGHN